LYSSSVPSNFWNHSYGIEALVRPSNLALSFGKSEPSYS